jgi:hypothetical protein
MLIYINKIKYKYIYLKKIQIYIYVQYFRKINNYK